MPTSGSIVGASLLPLWLSIFLSWLNLTSNIACNHLATTHTHTHTHTPQNTQKWVTSRRSQSGRKMVFSGRRPLCDYFEEGDWNNCSKNFVTKMVTQRSATIGLVTVRSLQWSKVVTSRSVTGALMSLSYLRPMYNYYKKRSLAIVASNTEIVE